MSDDDKDLEERRWQSKLTHWSKTYEHVLHSDRITADIGIIILKVVLFISCGGIVALLAAFPFVEANAEGASGIVLAGKYLLFAILLGVLALVCSYFRQGEVTHIMWDHMKDTESVLEYPNARLASKILMNVTILLLTISVLAFCYGAIMALDAMSVSIPPLEGGLPFIYEEYM